MKSSRPDTVRPNPRIPRHLADKLRMIAKSEHRSLNEQIIVAIEAHVKDTR